MTKTETQIAAIILAAGLSSRYRAADPSRVSKVLAPYNGEAMVRHVARAALAAHCAPVIVVTGHAAQEVENSILDLRAQPVFNPDFANGIASSLQCGIAALPEDCDAVFVMLADMPDIKPVILANLAARLRQAPAPDAVIPAHKGQRGNPVLLARSMFEGVLNLQGDEGARKLLRRDGLRIAEVESGPEILIDIDTPQAPIVPGGT